ncbi:MAG: 8-oxoguanine deaminase [Alphaproteobacteria bacterium]|jgi:cytosine/adenosine deaminase-related metal-dependent hydrolase|nr:8-oxoguanine deaminase [Alphaproteobacteria bacterium]
MSKLLIKNASVIATMDDDRTELINKSIYCEDGRIIQIGVIESFNFNADVVIDATDMVVIPGLVNTHHHLFQNLTRCYPGSQNESLFGWLTNLYPIWNNILPSDIYISTLIGLSEMVISGCTTSSDHLYLFPNGSKLEDQIEAAMEVGCRFHATRGSMSIGESKGGLPPDSLTEDEDYILKDCQRVIEKFHDSSDFSMLKIALAPCSPFSVSQNLMKQTAKLGRDFSVSLHTHLAENIEDIIYTQEHFGMRPGQYIEELGWVGNDVWHAHCVKLNKEEIDLFSRTGTGIAHCPCSNMRLGSGIAPLRKWIDEGVKVGLGVDGSSSNDSGYLLSEARQAMLLQRVNFGANKFSPREALFTATRGGAEVLNRDDIGQISIGKAADFAIYDLNKIAMSGAWSDPLAALILCTPLETAYTICNGEIISQNGHLNNFDLNLFLEKHKAASKRLLGL